MSTVTIKMARVAKTEALRRLGKTAEVDAIGISRASGTPGVKLHLVRKPKDFAAWPLCIDAVEVVQEVVGPVRVRPSRHARTVRGEGAG